MSDLVTQVNEDGTTDIVETKQVSNYEMELDRVNPAEVPSAPPTDSLSKLFKPKYVLYVTAEDGEKIPFVYKRVDPATLLVTNETPLTIDTNVADTAQQVENRLKDFRETYKNPKDAPQEVIDELNEFLLEENTVNAMKQGLQLRKNAVQAGVISPQITDEIYEELDDHILDALHEAITGGVTSQTELVEHFRNLPKTT